MAFFHYISRPSDPAATAPETHFAGAAKFVPAAPDATKAVAADLSAARQFEALLIQQLLKQVRQAGLQKGLLESDQTRLVQSIADEQLAQQLAQPGLGLAQALLDQIRGPDSANRSLRDNSLANLPSTEGSVFAHNKLSAVQPYPFGVSDSAKKYSTEGGMTEAKHPESPVASTRIQAGFAAAGASFGKSFVSGVLDAVQGAPRHIHHFVARMGDAARGAARLSGLPAELILGQAALETGWGRREIKGGDGQPSYNVFGIKASSGWKGRVVEILTTEYTNNRPHKVVQAFRAYGSYNEAFADYARLISQNARYKQVVAAASPSEAAYQIQKAGYATDPSYADKLISVMAYFQPRLVR